MKTTKISIKTLLMVALIPATAALFNSCKDKKEDDPKPETKTLTKSKLYDKKWYPKPQAIIHEFKTGGVYGGDGTWKWINNSDTMEIVYSDGLPAVKWKFYWSSDHEMSCKMVTSSNETLFKDVAW